MFTCQRTELALVLWELVTSALDEIAEGDVPRGSVRGRDEMKLLQKNQQLESKLLEMSVRCGKAEALRQEAKNAVLKMSMRCEETEVLRQEAENAVLEMSIGCEEAERMRSECERVLRFGAEQESTIGLMKEEIARIQKEGIESAADDAKDLAGNLRKEISDLQAQYEQACGSAREVQWRLESIQETHKSVGCQSEEDIQRGFTKLQELEKNALSIEKYFGFINCKNLAWRKFETASLRSGQSWM